MRLSAIIALLLFVNNSIAQQKPDFRSLYTSGRYAEAIPLLKDELKGSPDDAELNYRLGICYLNTFIDRSQSIQYLERAARTEKPEPDIFLALGKAYHVNYKFDDAIDSYKKFLSLASNKKEIAYAERAVRMCYNAKDLIQFQQDVSFENLGKNVNSPYAEYNPYFTLNEGMLYFTSKRKGTTGNQQNKDGSYPSDIFSSEVKNGNFAKARNLGTLVNTLYNEDISGLSNDGKTLFIFVDNIEANGISDVFFSEARGKQFQRPQIMGKNVDTEKANESAACLSPDGNTLYFSSDRDGSYGGKDIYMSNKLPNGDWGVAVNLGNIINTPYDEDFPNISHDGKTFYFASQGHNSMGGYDIFKSLYNEETQAWEEAVNIGHPVNTPDDNTTFAVTKTGREAYVSLNRPDAFGDLDIYKVTFNQVDPKFTVFKGYLQNIDSTNVTKDASIQIVNKNKELFGSYTIPSSKKGKYLFYLPPGKYDVTISAEGYKELLQEIIVLDKSGYKNEIERNFIINKPGDEKKPLKKTAKQPQRVKKS